MLLPKFLHGVHIDPQDEGRLTKIVGNWMNVHNHLKNSPIWDAQEELKKLMVLELRGRNRQMLLERMHARLCTLRRQEERAQFEFPEESQATTEDVELSYIVRPAEEIEEVYQWCMQHPYMSEASDDPTVEVMAYVIDWLKGDELESPIDHFA